MGLRVRTNIPALEIQKHVKKAAQNTEKEFSKLASGKRIINAADDAAGLALATQLEATNRGLKQATRNANSAISLMQTAEGGITEISNILVRLRELSVQAASDTIDENERELLDKEVQQLILEADRISQATTFNGKKLISEDTDTDVLSFYVGAFEGEENQIDYDTSTANLSASALGISGVNIIDRDSAIDAFGVVDEAIDYVASVRAELGAVQTRLHSAVDNLETQTINQNQAQSLIEDVDIAESTAKLASNSIIKEAGIASLAQANRISHSAIKLL